MTYKDIINQTFEHQQHHQHKLQHQQPLNQSKNEHEYINYNIKPVNLINQLNIYICSIIVILGIIGNLVSFCVFVRAGKKISKSRIITKHLLILLTISNSVYLIFFWYFSVFPKLLTHFKQFRPFKDFYIINSNIFVCKLVSYWISIAICVNSSITASFSLERALAINFPLKFKNFRENNSRVFKIIVVVICMVSVTLPLYNLILTNLTKRGSRAEIKCDIPVEYETAYFNLTILFILITLAVPFLIITISNSSILLAIDRNRKKFFSNRLVDNSKIDQSMRLTKILITISASFVLLNFPYFIAWCRYALFRLSMHRDQGAIFTLDEAKHLEHLYDMVKLTEILNLFNYAFTGILYFASAKIFRKHLHSVIGLNSPLGKSTDEE